MKTPDGQLEDPDFDDVPRDRHWTPPAKPWPWDEILEKVRQHPGRPATIALYTTGTRHETHLHRRRDTQNIRRGLRTRYPMERWRIEQRMIPDTWYHRAIVATFLGYYANEAERAREVAEASRRHQRVLDVAEGNRWRAQRQRSQEALIRARETATG